MVALSFQKRFRDPILARTKRQTLRNERKLPIRAGQTLHLYTGLRTKHTRIIGLATCVTALPISIDFAAGIVTCLEAAIWDSPQQLQRFAEADGFLSWDALERFWAKHHPGVEQWEGVRIFWGDTLKAPQP